MAYITRTQNQTRKKKSNLSVCMLREKIWKTLIQETDETKETNKTDKPKNQTVIHEIGLLHFLTLLGLYNAHLQPGDK